MDGRVDDSKRTLCDHFTTVVAPPPSSFVPFLLFSMMSRPMLGHHGSSVFLAGTNSVMVVLSTDW